MLRTTRCPPRSRGELEPISRMAPAFGRRCIASGGVAPPSHTPGMLGRRALPDGRLAALGAAPPFLRWVLDVSSSVLRRNSRILDRAHSAPEDRTTTYILVLTLRRVEMIVSPACENKQQPRFSLVRGRAQRCNV